MIINVTVLLIIIVCLFVSYKKTVVILAPLSQFLEMLKVPFIHLPFGIFTFIAFIILALLPLKIKKNEFKNSNYPLWIATFAMGLSYFLSNWFGKEVHWASSIAEFISVFIYPFVLWISINNLQKAKLFTKTLFVFLTILCTYAFYELITNSNPIIEFFISHDLASAMNADRIRFGIKRLQSFMTYNGAFGLTCSLGFISLLYLKLNFRDFIRSSNINIIILLIACFLGILFTGTRSVMVAFAIGLLAFINLNMLRKKSIYSFLFILLLISPIIISISSEYFLQIIGSFTETDNVSGSNINMRANQLAITLYYWAQSPFFGNGPLYLMNVVKETDPGILGAESIWFLLLGDYGLLGCVAFIILIIQPIIKLKKSNLTPLIFLVLAFLINKSLSSVPGISIGYHLLFVVFFLKLNFLNNKQKITND